MRFGIEVKERDLDFILKTINENRKKEIKLDELIMRLLEGGISSSDLLFLILQKLSGNQIESKRGVVKVLREVTPEETKKIKDEIRRGVERRKKLFVTPLEIGKFYQCPRRLWLEKIVLSRQFKERVGKVWDGEVVHLAINLLIKDMEKPMEDAIKKASEIALKKYAGKTKLKQDALEGFLKKFYELMNEESFDKIFTELNLESIKLGIIGTPDLVGVKKEELIPIDLKLGRLSKRGVKKEHVLQSVGEGILVESYFRKRVDNCYIIYFESNSLVRIKLTDNLKHSFFDYKKSVESMFKSRYIPPMSRLPNFRNRVCKGCHVRTACNNIETFKRVGRPIVF